jgi:hypothetical protein
MKRIEYEDNSILRFSEVMIREIIGLSTRSQVLQVRSGLYAKHLPHGREFI